MERISYWVFVYLDCTKCNKNSMYFHHIQKTYKQQNMIWMAFITCVQSRKNKFGCMSDYFWKLLKLHFLLFLQFWIVILENTVHCRKYTLKYYMMHNLSKFYGLGIDLCSNICKLQFINVLLKNITILTLNLHFTSKFENNCTYIFWCKSLYNNFK